MHTMQNIALISWIKYDKLFVLQKEAVVKFYYTGFRGYT